MTKFQRSFITIISAIVLFLSMLAGGAVPVRTYAAEVGKNRALFEARNVSEDLQDSAVDGVKFDYANYNFDTRKEMQLYSLVEFCYSFYESRQSDFGLYLYVYNPKGTDVQRESALNAVTMRAGADERAPFRKYPLKFLNQTTERNREGLFFKYKIDLTAAQRKEILLSVNSAVRIYRVSEIELMTKGERNATAYNVGTTYRYEGYAGGYGSNANAESTLTCAQEQAETLSLDVHQTVRHIKGIGENFYTSPSLYSVYFAVPNNMLERYGEMSAIHAQWLSAVLAPMLVTGNREAYDAVLPFLGYSDQSNLEYRFRGGNPFLDNTLSYIYNPSSPLPDQWQEPDDNSILNPFRRYWVKTLYGLFYAGAGTDSADNYTVTETALKEKLLELTRKYGGELANGKYSKVLFDSVDEEITEITLTKDEEHTLTHFNLSTWEVLFPFLILSNFKDHFSYEDIPVIYPVKETDVIGSPERVCEHLYISDADYDEFKRFYDKNGKDSTIYLFRYQMNDYISQEARVYKNDERIDTNAYFFQETVNLDFDIIDVSFSNGEKETVIPVAAKPLDVIAAATPPIFTQTDASGLPWWVWLIIAMIAIVILSILCAIFKPVAKIVLFVLKKVWFIICLPFRGLAALVRAIKARREEKRAERERREEDEDLSYEEDYEEDYEEEVREQKRKTARKRVKKEKKHEGKKTNEIKAKKRKCGGKGR